MRCPTMVTIQLGPTAHSGRELGYDVKHAKPILRLDLKLSRILKPSIN